MPSVFRILALCPIGLSMACSQNAVEALESYADDICACEDADCIESVRQRWEEENVERIATTDLSDEETQQGSAAIERAQECQSLIQP